MTKTTFRVAAQVSSSHCCYHRREFTIPVTVTVAEDGTVQLEMGEAVGHDGCSDDYDSRLNLTELYVIETS